MVMRWFAGFFKALCNIWDWDEWFYHTKTGLDPKLPAHSRWEIQHKVEDKPPASDAERIMPLKNHMVVLQDKFSLTPDDVVFYTTDHDKANMIVEEFKRELRSRTSGNFYYKMIKRRNLDFIHNYKFSAAEPLVEGTEIDPEQEREKFHR